MDTAIIGTSCRLPDADNYQSFWENLVANKSAISAIPKERWDWSAYWSNPEEKKNKSCSKWGGFVNDVDAFDNDFFELLPTVVKTMDQSFEGDLDRGFQVTVPAWVFLSLLRCANTWATDTVESHTSAALRPAVAPEPAIVVLSARSAQSLHRYLKSVWDHLERDAVASARFADFAYSSQVGRIAFEHRLAIVAADAGEFVAKAEQYLVRGDSAVVHAGHGCAEASLSELLAGDAGERFVEALVQARHWDKLASLWVRGCEIDWQRLHAGAGRRRLSFPDSPFEDVSCDVRLSVAPPALPSAAAADAPAGGTPQAAASKAPASDALRLRNLVPVRICPVERDSAVLAMRTQREGRDRFWKTLDGIGEDR